ncbi:response regulator [Nostocoides sp. F2B08]|uniref:response regulator transcription factor n=1 Tax=Nostocoides sp. F2B08 TaxID=2653936 RepID=UPI001263243C|nr:response regulator transcription factor [Tetrasphaera sp. F2B08]KAB7743569.1 response regulator [Tetrasphaera sp. F2B08]
MRVVIADDVMLVRSGIARLLADHDVETVGEAADVPELMRLVALERPDVAIVDIRMPPTQTDEGLVAAQRLRRQYPETAVLVLSQHVEPVYAMRLFTDQPVGLGYLLKERVADVAVLVDALRRVREGECVIDPTIVTRIVRAAGPDSALHRLSPRERSVLLLMAEGRSNAGIASELGLGERTVEAACAGLFRKLDLAVGPDVNRRVLAVLAFLQQR